MYSHHVRLLEHYGPLPSLSLEVTHQTLVLLSLLSYLAQVCVQVVGQGRLLENSISTRYFCPILLVVDNHTWPLPCYSLVLTFSQLINPIGNISRT